MNSRMKDLHVLAMYLFGGVGMLLMVMSDPDRTWINLLMSLCWLFSFTVRNLFFHRIDHVRKWAVITYAAEVLLLFGVGMSGTGNQVKILLLVTVADCCIAWPVGYAVIFGGAAFVAYIAQFYSREAFHAKDLILRIAGEFPVFVFIALTACLMGRLLKSNALVEKSILTAREREVALKGAYDELRKAYETLEEMASLKERNRIAREIHDTVGHTLTTVIVEMEAGRMLAEKDIKQATGKFYMAHQQAVKALDEMRRSVRLLANEKPPERDLRQRILDVVEETEVHAGVTIKYAIDIPEKLDVPQSNILVRILKEGLANGIRHGGSTAFFLKLWAEEDEINFLLQDNGKGCHVIQPGFGMESMKQNIDKAGGKIAFSSEPGEGFEIRIGLPI